MILDDSAGIGPYAAFGVHQSGGKYRSMLEKLPKNRSNSGRVGFVGVEIFNRRFARFFQ
jgi:hypothetical protein